VLSKEGIPLPGQALIQLLRDKAITHVTLPPAVLAVLSTEELPADYYRRWGILFSTLSGVTANRRF